MAGDPNLDQTGDVVPRVRAGQTCPPDGPCPATSPLSGRTRSPPPVLSRRAQTSAGSLYDGRGQSLRQSFPSSTHQSTLSDLQAHARGLGGKCLAEQYAKSSEGLPWRCKAGHTWTAPWSRIRRGAWCPDCARERRSLPKPRLTLEVMHTYAAKFGGKCLSDRYVNCNTKLTWQCAKGHVFEAVQYSVAAGSWCPDCAGARKGSLADLVAVARERGGECLSREYLGVSASYRWRCAEGHEWNAVAGNVKHRTWCPVCSGRRTIGLDELVALAREHGGVCLSTIYVNLQTHMRWRCAEGHEWQAVPATIKRGSWCPVCALDKRVLRTAHARRPRL